MSKKLRILILEDRQADAELMLREVRNAGYEPEWKRVETEAEYLAQLDQGWELVLADYALPQFTGLRALELLMARRLDIPFILVSGSIGEDVAVAAMKAGANDYVMKTNLARLGPSVKREMRDAATRRERRRTQKRLVEARNDWIDTFDSISDMITVHDKDFHIILANKSAERFLGLSALDKEARTKCFRSYHGTDHPPSGCPTCACLASKQPTTFEFFEPHLKRHLEIRAIPRFSPSREVIGLVHIVRDITERKLAEAELQKMQKLQSVGTLAGGIAHDFNNILLGLFGNISMAMDDLSKEHPSYALLEEAQKSMSRAVRLTKQLLTFAKGGEPVKENVSLDAMIEEVTRFDLSGSNVSLVYRPAPDLWPVEADKGQIQQVVSNLVINARQAMPNGGHLTVALENVDLPEAAVPGLRQGRYVKVAVQDEGNGIDPKHLDRIFDPYFTTKTTGHGLGLATVYSIILKHGGHIGVVSELGKGSTFTFYLPASASPPSAEVTLPSTERPPAAPERPSKVLVMDDEEMVCALAARMLARCGYAVATAPGGLETIALYRQALEAGEPFDAVVMDLTIPGGIGGLETVKALQALDPDVRAIVSSGYAEDPVMANPAAYGFKGTVAKPYTRSQLRDVVSRVLECC